VATHTTQLGEDGRYALIVYSSADGIDELLMTDLSTSATHVVEVTRVEHFFMELDRRALFLRRTPEHGEEIWTTDGTEAGTMLLADMNPGPSDGFYSPLTTEDGLAYFLASTHEFGEEIWVTDGTPQGTRMVADIFPGVAGSSATLIGQGMGRIYVQAEDPTHGREYWVIE